MSFIIVFTGKAGTGKDTAASFLIQQGFRQLAFASALKTALSEIAGEPIWMYQDNDTKEKPSASLGMSRRKAMQVFGETVRNIFHEDVWLNKVESELVSCRKAVITDCRYENEAKFLKKHGAVFVRVTSPYAKKLHSDEAQHKSENANLDEYIDEEIVNDGSLKDLESAVHKIIYKYFGEAGFADKQPYNWTLP